MQLSLEVDQSPQQLSIEDLLERVREHDRQHAERVPHGDTDLNGDLTPNQ
jgi:hypothetical protein